MVSPLVNSGADGLLRLRRLGEPFAEGPEIRELVFLELVIATCHVTHRFVEPFLLMLWSRTYDFTTHNVLE